MSKQTQDSKLAWSKELRAEARELRQKARALEIVANINTISLRLAELISRKREDGRAA